MITRSHAVAVYLSVTNPSAKIVQKYAINIFNRPFVENFLSVLLGSVVYFKDVENTNGKWIKMKNILLSKKINVSEVSCEMTIENLDDIILKAEETKSLNEVSSILDLWDYETPSSKNSKKAAKTWKCFNKVY